MMHKTHFIVCSLTSAQPQSLSCLFAVQLYLILIVFFSFLSLPANFQSCMSSNQQCSFLMISLTTLHCHYKIIYFKMPSQSSFYLQSMSCYAALLKLCIFSLCLLWIYRSVGVSHRVWFMIAWLMRISILYGLLTSTAHKVHSVLFSVIQGHETEGKKTDFPWIMESLSSSRINKILLRTPR